MPTPLRILLTICGTVRHMHSDKPTHRVWFGADTNTIGRTRLPD